MKWNIRSKRFLLVSVMTVGWLVLLYTAKGTAIALAPYAYGLIAAYCGFETWNPTKP